MESVLVTGCAGFIGSHLSDALLKKGYHVVGIDNFDEFYSRDIKNSNLAEARTNSRFSFYEIDIRSAEQLDEITEPFSVVVHLAAKAGVLPSKKHPEQYITTNVLGTNNILDFMKRRSIGKYVFASSSSIYGNSKNIPFNEADDVNFPISPYAVTKKSCELLNHVYHHLYDIDTMNLRLFTKNRPHQHPDQTKH